MKPTVVTTAIFWTIYVEAAILQKPAIHGAAAPAAAASSSTKSQQLQGMPEAVATDLPLENFLQFGVDLDASLTHSNSRTTAQTQPITQTSQVTAPGLAKLPAASFVFIDLHLSHTGAATAAPAASKTVSQQQQHQVISPRSWCAFTLSTAFVVKAMCIASNVAYQAAPIPQIGNFNKYGDTGEVDAAPFISIMYGGCQWCFYGMFAYLVTKKSGFLVLVYSNFIGAFLGVYYLWGFQRNCRKQASLQMLFQYYKVAATLAFLQLAAMLALPRERALFFCGLVSSVCSAVAASSLLTNLPTVFKTRSSSSMNITMLGIGVCSSSLWLLCGFFLWDAWIIIPNSLGFLFQALAIGVVLRFPAAAAACQDSLGDMVDVKRWSFFTDPAGAVKRLLNVAALSRSQHCIPAVSTGHSEEHQADAIRAASEVAIAAADNMVGETGGTV